MFNTCITLVKVNFKDIINTERVFKKRIKYSDMVNPINYCTSHKVKQLALMKLIQQSFCKEICIYYLVL